MYARECGIGHQVIAFGGRLEDTIADVFEDATVFALGSEAGFFLAQ
jgi:hypothetical protein